MSIHWKSLNTAGKVAAIRSVYEPGMTTREIASFFRGSSRNAIIGMYSRYPDQLADCRLLPTGMKSVRRERKEKTVSLSAQYFKKPKKQYREGVEAHLCGKPLMALERDQCRWPVNDADVGDLHLFCGMPSTGSYCEHHSSRAYREDR